MSAGKSERKEKKTEDAEKDDHRGAEGAEVHRKEIFWGKEKQNRMTKANRVMNEVL